MPKPKYDTHVKPNLEQIKQLRQDGMKLDSIAETLNIHPSTFYDYMNQYSELSDCLNDAKTLLHENMIIKAEDSLYAKLEDRWEDVEETTEIWSNRDGKVEKSHVQKKKKKIPADTTAIIFALKNRDSKYWKDKQEIEGSLEIKGLASLMSEAEEVLEEHGESIED